MNNLENRTTNYLAIGTPIEILKSISEGAVKTKEYKELEDKYLAENISMKTMISGTMTVALPILGIILAVASSKLKGFMVAFAAIIPAAVWLSYKNREDDDYRSRFKQEETVIANLLSKAINYCSEVKKLKSEEIKNEWIRTSSQEEANQYLEKRINDFEEGRFEIKDEINKSLYKEIPTAMPYIHAIKRMQFTMYDHDSSVHKAWWNYSVHKAWTELQRQCRFQAQICKDSTNWQVNIWQVNIIEN